MLRTFRDVSGKQYTFNVYASSTSYIDTGGIYINPAGNYSVIYVGETRSMKDRIPDHEKWDCAENHGVDSMCVLWETNLLTRLAIEQDLIQAYDSPCNKT